jgi:hypothetical protein
MLVQRVLETAFTWHNYGKLPIGNRSDIEGVPIQRLAAFYQKYYQPDNAILTIAGKFDDAKTLALVAGAFGGLPKPQRTLEKPYTTEPTQDGERSVTLRRVGDTQGIAVLYHVPAATHPDAPALEVLAGVLGDSPSGRLYKTLVDNKKSVSANMGMEELHDPGFLLATATLRQDQSLDDARQALLKTVEGFVNEPPTKEEVERAKQALLKNIELNLNNSEFIGLTISNWVAQGDWRLLFFHRDRLRKVTPEDALRVATAYLKPSNRTVGLYLPVDKLPERAEVHIAMSETMRELGLTSEIDESGRYEAIRPRLNALDRVTHDRERRKLGAAPDYMVGSAHAVTMDGEVIVGSGSGSQLGAYAYAAGHVILVVGHQKLVRDVPEGLRRLREYSLPRVRAHAGPRPPGDPAGQDADHRPRADTRQALRQVGTVALLYAHLVEWDAKALRNELRKACLVALA